MKKATKLMELINTLLNEKDNSKIEGLYKKIANETMSIEYKEIGSRVFTDLMLKQYIRLAVKEYVYSSRSSESENILRDLVDTIKDFDIN